MAVDDYKKNRKVSKKPAPKPQVRPPVKAGTGRPTKRYAAQGEKKTVSGINPLVKQHIAELSKLAPKYIVPYEAKKGTIGSSAINPWMGARGKYGDVLTQQEWNEELPNFLKYKYNMGYTVLPDAQPYQQQTYYDGYTPSYGGGGGGGGGGGYTPPPPPIPEMKIRTTAGLRRSPYWESDDPYNQVFEPRFVIVGNTSGWG